MAEEALARRRAYSRPAARPSPCAGQLQQIDLFTGRFDDLRRRIQDEWSTSGHKPEILQKHFLLDDARSYPIDALRARLEAAGLAAPEDDRVWLGKAYLAMRTARYAEADAWLKRCLERRPEDPSVWRARLEWAMASDRPDDAVEAMRHLPAEGLEPGAILSLRAWLAAHLGDPRAEQSALEQWREQAPGDMQALVRQIAMAARDGRADQLADLRRRKAELDRAADAYRMTLIDRVPSGRFDELGRLAESLGRRFEARGWWTLAVQQPAHAAEARDALARIDRNEQAIESFRPSRRTPSAAHDGRRDGRLDPSRRPRA